jgi:hypothetical protein
VGLLNEYRLDS